MEQVQWPGEQVGDTASVQSWHSTTGNLIGRGFGEMRQVFGCGDGVIMAAHPNDVNRLSGLSTYETALDRRG
jgi:hypothetical protein